MIIPNELTVVGRGTAQGRVSTGFLVGRGHRVDVAWV